MQSWVLLATAFVAAAVPLEKDACGYQSCPISDAGVLNVHIVPHTHDDVGWLKTVDQYYYGSKNYIQKAGVQYILDSVIDELWKDDSRRFIYVETAFFWKWWTRQKSSVKTKVHTLVSQGRLEFIGGAWSMNDEADTRYQSTIDQFTWGLRKLNDTFGECGRPRVAWQIDPFGHSRQLASVLAEMGYDGLFHGRIDYQDKGSRLANRTMEMLWRGDDDLGAESDIFTGVLYNTYSPPAGFCFDVLCSDEPIIDDVDSPMYNVEKRVETFFEVCRNMSAGYRSNNVLVTMGGDFTYQDALMWFTNLDRLIQYANLKAAKNKLGIKLFYSTPSCYLKAVHDANPVLPTKRDDFMPYASDPHSYWTGYFTSRPTIKYFERRGNAYLQMVKQLQVLANLEDHKRFLINELKSAMGIMQHHDAVTGTEKQHVANDYARILDAAIEDGLFVARQAFSKLTERDPQNVTNLKLTRCQLNISECGPTEKNREFVVTVYNPLGWTVRDAIRLPIKYNKHTVCTVYDYKGQVVASQAVRVPSPLVQVPTRHSETETEVVFEAEVPPLGYRMYYVRLGNDRKTRSVSAYDEVGLSRREMLLINEMARRYIDNVRNKPKQQTAADDASDNLAWDNSESAQNEIPPTSDDVNLEKLSPKQIKQIMREYNDRLKNFVASSGAYDGATKQNGVDVQQDGVITVPMSTLDLESYPEQDDQVYSEDGFIENEYMKVSVTAGALTSLTLRGARDVTVPLRLAARQYVGWRGDNMAAGKRSSGAYIFRPNGTATDLTLRNTTKIIKGPVVQEIHQEYSDYASTVIRLYNDSKFLEVEWLVGPIPIKDNRSKEIVFTYSTDLINNHVFYTDSNGKQSLKRVLNKRPQYNLTVYEPIAANYYPINSKIYIEDSARNLRFSVLNDRAQGGSSLEDGQIEIMVHRRLLSDDAFGVGEALNETAEGYGLVARGKHYIHIGIIEEKATRMEKVKAVEIVQPLEVLVSNDSNLTFDDWRWLKNDWSGMKTPLPEGMHLLTLENWRKGEILIRLENIFDKGDFNSTDGVRKVDLSKLFVSIELKWIRETSLAANQYWEDRKRLNWKTEGDVFDEGLEERAIEGFNVDFKPSQIRTFVVGYTFKG